jgi:hypothetical protein
MTAKEFEGYARDCVRLAEQPGVTNELREQLLEMARDWMKCAMDGERPDNIASHRQRPEFSRDSPDSGAST